MDLALQAHLSLHREVPLGDITRVPREVGEEATVEDASPLVEVEVESTGVLRCYVDFEIQWWTTAGTMLIVSQPTEIVAQRLNPQMNFNRPPSSQKFAPTLGLDGR